VSLSVGTLPSTFNPIKMEDNIMNNQAPNADNLNTNALPDTTEAPNADKPMLAGKFKDRTSLEKSTAELFQSLEGKPLSVSEKLAIKQLPDDELAKFYQEIQADFTKARQSGDNQTDFDQDALKEALKGLGFVSKDELERQEYDKEQIRLYLAQDPTAESRMGLIQTLKDTPEFANKPRAVV
jgi:hypothetical protein